MFCCVGVERRGGCKEERWMGWECIASCDLGCVGKWEKHCYGVGMGYILHDTYFVGIHLLFRIH